MKCKKESTAQKAYLRRQLHRRRLVLFCRIFLFVFFLICWEMSARLGLIDAFIFSSPSRTVRCFLRMMQDKSILIHTGVTLYETLISFTLVILCGLIGAVLLWSSRNLSEILEPYLVMLNSLPKSALAPILIVWLGSNIRTIIVASISVAVFGSILTLHNGFFSMDPDQIKLIRSLGGNRIHILTKVLLPGSIPLILANMKVNIGLCLVGVIIGEFLAGCQTGTRISGHLPLTGIPDGYGSDEYYSFMYNVCGAISGSRYTGKISTAAISPALNLSTASRLLFLNACIFPHPVPAEACFLPLFFPSSCRKLAGNRLYSFCSFSSFSASSISSAASTAVSSGVSLSSGAVPTAIKVLAAANGKKPT